MTSTPRFTIDDLETLPDTLDDTRYELIDGELHIAHQPHWTHQFAGAMLGMELQAWSRRTSRGSANIAPGVIFSQDDAVAPDVLWISRKRRAQGLRPDGKLYIAPEIAIEILSPGGTNERRDRDLKRKLYAREGVEEYWIVDWRAADRDLSPRWRHTGARPDPHRQRRDHLTAPPRLRLPRARPVGTGARLGRAG